MLTRDELLNLAWGWDFDGTDRVIDGHIKSCAGHWDSTHQDRGKARPQALEVDGDETKSKNFGNFFVRVGAGFLAFWLVTMGAFSLLLGQQRAKLMAADIEDYAGRFLGNYAKYMLDSKEQDTDDPVNCAKD